uniref:RING-type E3 ubiquitin transferase n=1 Tax=Terrapene triunguis TaxID=2587831 RepID=A0A674K9M1_9SAUR
TKKVTGCLTQLILRTKESEEKPEEGKNISEDVPVAAEGSSDSRCPICLERIRNVSYLNPCFHGFCFVCIQEWSERKAESYSL